MGGKKSESRTSIKKCGFGRLGETYIEPHTAVFQNVI